MSPEPISPERALELYLDHRRNEVARQTLVSHESRINKLVNWCEEQGIGNTNKLTGRDLYEYRIWRRNDGNLVKTSEKTQMATIRVFIRFLESIEAVEPDLHTKVQLPSLSSDDDVRDSMITAEEADEILSFLRKYRYASVDHVIVALVWHTAMRRGSVRALDIDDYNPNEQYIEVVHREETPLKNQERGERYIALSNTLCQLLVDWLEDKRPDITDSEGREPLLASNQGRLHPTTITRTLYKLTRPCVYSGECPHNRDIDNCEAVSHNAASKCPSSNSPHEVVAECHDIDPDAIEANLEGRVDPESLASLWSEAPRESFGVVSFTFYDCRVTVTAAGNVEARLHQ